MHAGGLHATLAGVVLALFIGASLFTLVLQWAVASPYGVFVYSIGPILLLYAAARPGYHAVSTNTIDGILGWSESGG